MAFSNRALIAFNLCLLATALSQRLSRALNCKFCETIVAGLVDNLKNVPGVLTNRQNLLNRSIINLGVDDILHSLQYNYSNEEIRVSKIKVH